MCRWLGYFGEAIRIEELVYNPDHSLIRSVSPAWSDRNLRDLCAQIRSPLFLAHIRAATGTPVQQTNCHPFRQPPLAVRAQRLHRRLHAAAPRPRAGGRPGRFEHIEGTTDSELMFLPGAYEQVPFVSRG